MKSKFIMKVFSAVLMASLLLSSSISSYAQGNVNNPVTNVKETAINNLLSGGWNTSQINDLLSDTELLKYKDVKKSETTAKYVKVSCDTKETEVYDEKQKSMVKKEEPIEETKKFIELTEQQFNNEVEQVKKEKRDIEKNISLSQSEVSSNLQTNYATSGPRDSYSSDGYLKYTIYAGDVGNRKYFISYRWEWVLEPSYTLTDVFGLAHSDQVVRSTDDPTTYVYRYDYIFNSPYMGYETVQNTYTENNPEKWNPDSGNVVYSVNLKNKETKWTSDNQHYYYYGNHRGYQSYYVNVASPDFQYFYIYGAYRHQQTSFKISPSFSWPIGGSLSVEREDKFCEETPNAELTVNCN